MKCAIITYRDIITLNRWDAGHIIECTERVGDILETSKFLGAGRNKKQTGLLDLVDKAVAFNERN